MREKRKPCKKNREKRGPQGEILSIEKASGFFKAVSKGKASVYARFIGNLPSQWKNDDGNFRRKKTRKKRTKKPYQTPASRGVPCCTGGNETYLYGRFNPEGQWRIFGENFRAAVEMDYPKRKNVKVAFFPLMAENARYLRKRVFKPYLKMLCMRMILFYQRHLSLHQCKFRPTCSQYTLESINNRGVVTGILLGAWRILRCHPWTKGGIDPATECYRKLKWLI